MNVQVEIAIAVVALFLGTKDYIKNCLKQKEN